MREDETQTGAEEVFDDNMAAEDEEFFFASLPSQDGAYTTPFHLLHASSPPTRARKGGPVGSPTNKGLGLNSPSLDPVALAEKRRRMHLLTNDLSASQAKQKEVGPDEEANPSGWVVKATTDNFNVQEKKIVLNRQLQQIKQHVRLLTKSKNEVIASKCPVPMTTAIARAVEEVGYLDDENELTHDFKLHSAPSHNLLTTDLRRKTWLYKMKTAVQCRLRLMTIVKNALQYIAMHEMEPSEPIFGRSSDRPAKGIPKNVEIKAGLDEIVGPAFDYDYASIDRMGHPGVVGFTTMTKASLQPLRVKRWHAKQLKREEEEHLRVVMEAAEDEYSAQNESLEHELKLNGEYEEHMSQAVKDGRNLDSKLQLNEEQLIVLRRQRDESEFEVTRVARQQLRVVILVWRAFTCAARPEAHPDATTHPHVKQMIGSQELPGYLREEPERPQCKRNLAAMAQEAQKLGGIGGEEIDAVQPWLGSCFPPPSFEGDAEGKGESLCEGLELEHVYGYRGSDCRSNTFQLRTGEAVYHAGSFGIVHDLVQGPNQHRQIWFKNWHKGKITCAAMHPDGSTVATAESAGAAHDYPLIYVWRMVSGEANLVRALNDPINKKVGMLEGVVSCLAFTKGGRYLVAIGDVWPRQSLTIYEWDTDQCGALIKHDLGRQKALSLAVNPYIDSIVVTGDRFLSVMYSPNDRKHQYRQVVRQLHWDLIRAEEQCQANVVHEDMKGGSDEGAFPNRLRDQFLFQTDKASGKVQKSYKRDILGVVPEQDEAGRDIWPVSDVGFVRLSRFIRECAISARRELDSKYPVSAIAECKCGLKSCEQLLELIEEGLVREQDTLVVDSIGPRGLVMNLQYHLESLLLESMEAMRGHQAIFERTYDIDHTLEEMFKEMRKLFALLLDGSMPLLDDLYRRTETGFNELVAEDKGRRLCVEPCYYYNRLGAGYWKINQNSPVMHTPKFQAVFCTVFTGPYTFVTGTEDGSLFFWDGSEFVGSTPLHDDAIIDMSIDMSGFESNGYFHLITAGYDGTIRLSKCERFEQGLRNQFYSGIVLHRMHKVVLPPGISCTQPCPAVSISNVIGLDKFSGLPCIDWIDKPAGHARFSMHTGVQFVKDQVPTSKHPFIVGTSDNSLFYINFGSFHATESAPYDIESDGHSSMCLPLLHSGGGVTCVSAHPRQASIMFSGGDDGVARLWDIVKRELKMSYAIKDNTINCSDFSLAGESIAVGLSKGGFLVFDSATLLPKTQLVFEFEVLMLPHQPNDLFKCSTSSGPVSLSEKEMTKKLDHLTTKRDYLERKSKGKQNIPAELVAEWEGWCAEIQVMENRVVKTQKSFFKGSYFVPEHPSTLSRRRLQIEELTMQRVINGGLTKPQQEDLIQATIREQRQKRLLISEIQCHIPLGAVSMTLTSPFLTRPTGRVTVQKFDEAVRHSKRSTLVVKYSPDCRFLAVAGIEKLVYIHQVLFGCFFLSSLYFYPVHQFYKHTVFVNCSGDWLHTWRGLAWKKM